MASVKALLGMIKVFYHKTLCNDYPRGLQDKLETEFTQIHQYREAIRNNKWSTRESSSDWRTPIEDYLSEVCWTYDFYLRNAGQNVVKRLERQIGKLREEYQEMSIK